MEIWNSCLSLLITRAALSTTIVNSPIYAVLFLVLTLLLSALILLAQGLEVIALLFIAIYVGAIAVLFLVVVITLNLKILKYKIVINTQILIFLRSIYIRTYINKFYTRFTEIQLNTALIYYNWIYQIDIIEPLRYYGQCLGSRSTINLFIVGLILLVALFGCIILVNAVSTKIFFINSNKKNYYQLVEYQISRRTDTAHFILRI